MMKQKLIKTLNFKSPRTDAYGFNALDKLIIGGK